MLLWGTPHSFSILSRAAASLLRRNVAKKDMKGRREGGRAGVRPLWKISDGGKRGRGDDPFPSNGSRASLSRPSVSVCPSQNAHTVVLGRPLILENFYKNEIEHFGGKSKKSQARMKRRPCNHLN